MAVKGRGYTKTSWAFEERPVASAKLNTWDDRIEAALELLHDFVTETWGGVDGVLRDAAGNGLAVRATTPESLSVEVQPGRALISRFPYVLDETTPTTDVVVPVSDPRIDLVQARLNDWDVHVKAGTESATPTAPAPDADAIALAELFLRPSMSSVRDVDDGTNGYITDVRTFL